MKLTFLAVLLASIVTSGCTSGTYDCANKAVQEAVLDTFNDVARNSYVFRGKYNWPFASEPEYLALADQTSGRIAMSNIITIQKDEDLGAYACSATFSTTTKSQTVSQELEYGVRKVESGETPFSIFYDRSQFLQIAVAAVNEIVEPYADERVGEYKAQIQAKHDSAMKANPPVPLTVESVRSQLFFSESDRDGSQIISAKLNADGLQDFIAFRRDYAAMNSSGQAMYGFYVLCLTQSEANEPGRENDYTVVKQGVLQASGSAGDLTCTVDPEPGISFEEASKMATVQTSDGHTYAFSCVASG